EGGGKLTAVDKHLVVDGAEVVGDDLDVTAVGVRLKGVGFKVFGVARIVHGVSVKRLFSCLGEGFGGVGGDGAGVEAARKEGADGHVGDELPADGIAEELLDPFDRRVEVVGVRPALEAPVLAVGDALGRHGDEVAGLDRKSTRLNSSHVKISYAVFCLKKKKTHEKAMTLCAKAEELRAERIP